MELCNDDIILAISSLLLPRDLASLALACKRFGMRRRNNAVVASSATSNDNKRAPTREQQRRRLGREGGGYNWPWSIMEEASRRQVSAAKNDENDRWKDSDLISIRGEEESWMAVHQRLHLLRTSLVFDRIIGNSIKYVDGDITRVRGKRTGDRVGYAVAICQRGMKAGTHLVEFVVEEVGGNVGFGIIRPIDDYPRRRMKCDEFRAYCNLKRRLNEPGYEGDVHQFYDQMTYLVKDDVIGMIIDLDRGALTVYRNEECLGVRVCTGLEGHYCWAVTMDRLGCSKPSVRIRLSVLISRHDTGCVPVEMENS